MKKMNDNKRPVFPILDIEENPIHTDEEIKEAVYKIFADEKFETKSDIQKEIRFDIQKIKLDKNGHPIVVKALKSNSTPHYRVYLKLKDCSYFATIILRQSSLELSIPGKLLIQPKPSIKFNLYFGSKKKDIAKQLVTEIFGDVLLEEYESSFEMHGVVFDCFKDGAGVFEIRLLTLLDNLMKYKNKIASFAESDENLVDLTCYFKFKNRNYGFPELNPKVMLSLSQLGIVFSWRSHCEQL